MFAEVLGLAGCGEGTEPKVEVVAGGGTAEPWDDPAQDELIKAARPIAAASVPRLIMVAPTR
jgi:hypothetical protein